MRGLDRIKRRAFIKLLGAGALLASWPVTRLIVRWPHELHSSDWRTLRKFVDNLIPATPASASASDAGVLDFLAASLKTHYAAEKPRYKQLTLALDAIARGRYQSSFAELSDEKATVCMVELESTEHRLFALLRTHAIEGYFSDPRHGGNRGFAGWKAVRLKSHILGVDFQ